jgi:hypothetical protein
MMEAVSISERPINFYQTSRNNIPEDSHKEVVSFALPSLQFFHRTSRSSGHHSCFIIGISLVQIWGQLSAISTEAFRGFPQPVHENAGIVPQSFESEAHVNSI